MKQRNNHSPNQDLLKKLSHALTPKIHPLTYDGTPLILVGDHPLWQWPGWKECRAFSTLCSWRALAFPPDPLSETILFVEISIPQVEEMVVAFSLNRPSHRIFIQFISLLDLPLVLAWEGDLRRSLVVPFDRVLAEIFLDEGFS